MLKLMFALSALTALVVMADDDAPEDTAQGLSGYQQDQINQSESAPQFDRDDFDSTYVAPPPEPDL